MIGKVCAAVLAASIVSGAGAAPLCFGTGDVASPDGALSAHITRLGRGSCGESRVEIFSADGHVLTIADFSSPDGQSGEGVVQAAWSPDSQFFVFSLSLSEPRTPLRYPIAIYARQFNKLRTLDASRPDFTLGADGLVMTGGDGKMVRMPLTAP